ncbi:MAG: histidine phosphatase family protein [Sedimentisphaerales bacterium]|nr:histidine phosphatase family protein [Sedimentisphaerales bacterium]
MKKLILVRAADTAWQEGHPSADESRIQGVVPLPLSELGKDSLRQMAEAIIGEKPDSIYSSGNESSGPTAKFLAEACNLKGKKNSDLHELDCGLWQGLKISDLKKRYGRAFRQWREDPTSVRPPQGESLRETTQRVAQALAVIGEKNPDKTIVIIAAMFVSAIIECLLNETPLVQLWQVIDHQEPLCVYNLQGKSQLLVPEKVKIICEDLN